jgi:hypothetical protein
METGTACQPSECTQATRPLGGRTTGPPLPLVTTRTLQVFSKSATHTVLRPSVEQPEMSRKAPAPSKGRTRKWRLITSFASAIPSRTSGVDVRRSGSPSAAQPPANAAAASVIEVSRFTGSTLCAAREAAPPPIDHSVLQQCSTKSSRPGRGSTDGTQRRDEEREVRLIETNEFKASGVIAFTGLGALPRDR